MFTDECGIHETGFNNTYYLRRPNQYNDPKFFVQTKAGGGHYVSIFGGVSKFGTTPLVVSNDDEERWDAKNYIKILKLVVEPFLYENDLLLQQDNAPTHTAKIV